MEILILWYNMSIESKIRKETHQFRREVPMNKNQFSQFQLSNEIIETLTLLDYNIPTAIQKVVIPHALAGYDIIAKAQTGSGKTAAFGIPLCEKISWEENLPQALVLEPTRELAQQVKTELFHIGRKKRIKIPALFGGMPIDKQLLTLKQKSHIIVGTPGRIMDHIRRKSLILEQVKIVVIDEADLMFQMGFAEEVTAILELLNASRQIMLFSATMEDKIITPMLAFMKDPKYLLLQDAEETKGSITQSLYYVNTDDKFTLFMKLLIHHSPSSCMIFCATREMVNTLYQKLRRERVRCGMLHGEMEQRDRLKTIESFRDGLFSYLVCTDVAARGIDFDSLTHVFQYDLPTNVETYVHRIGRTGRNGKSGAAISLASPDELRLVDSIEYYLQDKIPVIPLPTITEEQKKQFREKQLEKPILKKRKGAIFQKSITNIAIGGGRKSKMRSGDIVGAICSIHGITPEDIGIIDIRDSLTYVEILNQKGEMVLNALENKPIKGKIRKVSISRKRN